MKKRILPLLLLEICSLTFAATQYINKEVVSVQGKADPFVEVRIYSNKKKIKEVESNDEGMWIATDIPVSVGDNEVYAKAYDRFGNESKFSKKIQITVDMTPPKVLKFKTNRNKYKAGDVMRITAMLSEDTVSAVCTMPDGSELILNKRSGKKFSEEWDIPEDVADSQYTLSLVATDRASNITEGYSNSFRIINAIGEITIKSPSENSIVYGDTIDVKGIANGASEVAIGNNRMQVPADGSFQLAATGLKPAKNQIRVSAFYNGKSVNKDVSVIRLLTFPDIQSHPYRKEIEYLATVGYLYAYGNTNFFSPQLPMSRAEVITTLVQDIASSYAVYDSNSGGFIDVPSNYWANNNIAIAAQNRLIIGYPDKTFKPQQTITRAEMATFMVRFAGIPVNAAGSASFTDVNRNSWAFGYINAFVASGLMPPSWQQSQFFQPKRPVTRAEVAYILARVAVVQSKITTVLGLSPEFPTYSAVSSYGQFSQSQAAGTHGLSPMQLAQSQQQYSNFAPANKYNSYSASALGVQTAVGGATAGGLSPMQQAQAYQVPQTVQTATAYSKPPVVGGYQVPQGFGRAQSVYSVEVFPKRAQPTDELNVILFLIENIQSAYMLGVNQEKITFKKSESNKYVAAYRLPDNTPAGSYFFDIYVREVGGQMNTVKTETIQVLAKSSTSLTSPAPYTAPSSGLIYPESFSSSVPTYTAPKAVNESISVKSTPQISYSGGKLTRAKMLALLGEAGMLRKVQVRGAVADDVSKTHPQAGYIKYAIINEIVPNLKPGRFYPENGVSKAFAATVLVKRSKSKMNYTKAKTAPFSDVAVSHWASAHINTLKINGVVSGTNFAPDSKISEQEFRSWLARVRKL